MAGLFVLALLVPWTWEFFALNMADPAVTAQAVAVAAGAGGPLELGGGLPAGAVSPATPPRARTRSNADSSR